MIISLKIRTKSNARYLMDIWQQRTIILVKKMYGIRCLKVCTISYGTYRRTESCFTPRDTVIGTCTYINNIKIPSEHDAGVRQLRGFYDLAKTTPRQPPSYL